MDEEIPANLHGHLVVEPRQGNDGEHERWETDTDDQNNGPRGRTRPDHVLNDLAAQSADKHFWRTINLPSQGPCQRHRYHGKTRSKSYNPINVSSIKYTQGQLTSRKVSSQRNSTVPSALYPTSVKNVNPVTPTPVSKNSPHRANTWNSSMNTIPKSTTPPPPTTISTSS